MKLKIPLTQEHLDLGIPGSNLNCPVATAIHKATGNHVNVNQTVTYVYLPEGEDTEPKEKTLYHGALLRQEIMRFDLTKKDMKLGTLSVNLEQEFMEYEEESQKEN